MRCRAILMSTLLATVSAIPVQAQNEKPVTLVSWGGAYQKAQRETQWEPAAKELGFTFREATVSNSYAEIKLQVQSGNVTWDIVQMGSFEVDQAVADDLLEKIDYSNINRDDFLPGMARDYCLGTIAYSTVIAYSTKKYVDKTPKTWADFWNAKTFPGARAFNGNRAISVLEIALQADGVPPAEVYNVLRAPGGIDRGFRKLEELKPIVTAWWRSGAQQTQFVRDGEVDMTTGWNGRIQAAIDDGAPAAISFDGGVVQNDCYAVPKGAPNRDRAGKILAALTSPQVQANLANRLPYGPTNKRAFDLIPAKVAAGLPTSPEKMARQVIINDAWYTANMEAVQERFDRLRTK